MKNSVLLLGIIAFNTLQPVQAAEWPRFTPSKDNVPISYEVHGQGEPTLVFVHGWSCDARYWRKQVPVFSKDHRIILLDLAGHGHSGLGRSQYTMGDFGEDVRAVTEAVGAQRVILIGHSMGGSVIAEAARRMPDRVIGLIGVDTLENVEFPLTREEFAQMTVPLFENFPAGARQFVGPMLYTNTPADLREWILSDMSAAPPSVAMSAMNEMMSQFITGEAAKIFERIRVPIISVSGDLWPINYEANRKHMQSYEATVLPGADHFLQLDRPEDFNRALAEAIRKIAEAPAPEKASAK